MDEPSSSSSTTVVEETGGIKSGAIGKLLVNRQRQWGNPVLKYIRNVAYEWTEEIEADFEAGRGCAVLYLSLKWHKLHPGYIETRMNSDARSTALKVLLVVVNVEQCRFLLRELNLFSYRSGWTLLLSFSVEEAAEYLELLKMAEKRAEEVVVVAKKARLMDDSAMRSQLCSQAVDFLTEFRSITRSDAERLIGTFGSLKAIAEADEERLSLCPGLGPVKARNLYCAFRTPFTK